MKPNCRIRKAIVEDASLLAAAERQIAKVPGRLASLPEELAEENFRQKIAELSESRMGTYVVIESDGRVVGHALLDPLKLATTSHVVALTIAIHEGHQGQGFGRLLMEHLIAWAKAQEPIERFELNVRSQNTVAIRLYEKLGFVQEGRRVKRLKYGPGQYSDDISMALWVGPEGG